MSKFTLDTAIKHCIEVAEQKEHDSITTTGDYELDISMKEGCISCATNYRQVAEWLTELKELREENKVLISECDRLINEKGELNKFKEKAMLDICQREARLRDAKRLLKAAVEDFSEVKSYLSEPYSRSCDKWRYEDEALKLIGGESNGS